MMAREEWEACRISLGCAKCTFARGCFTRLFSLEVEIIPSTEAGAELAPLTPGVALKQKSQPCEALINSKQTGLSYWF